MPDTLEVKKPQAEEENPDRVRWLRRAAFVSLAIEQLDCPYIWGGRGEMLGIQPVRVFDCSGLVLWCAWKLAGTDMRHRANSDTIWNALPHVEAPAKPELGDLVFYGGGAPDDVSHVEVWLGDGRTLGAAGGGHLTTTLLAARQADAHVRINLNYLHRKDFRGFRRVDPLLAGERLGV